MDSRTLWQKKIALTYVPAIPEPETASSIVAWVLPIEIESPVLAWMYDDTPAVSLKFTLQNPIDTALYVPATFFSSADGCVRVGSNAFRRQNEL